AAELAREEVELARTFEHDVVLGVALRTLGAVSADLGIQEEAVAVLAGSEARVEHAVALVEFGAALRRSGQRREARDRLAEGMDLADRCGADAVAERAHAELLQAGARPRRRALSGADALTPSERRVADLAASGLTNKEIAQSLFVTLRTVEMHLS